MSGTAAAGRHRVVLGEPSATFIDSLFLLPALPPSWSAGHARGLRCRGGHVVDVAWRDGRLTEATVTAGGRRVILEVTPTTSAVVRDAAGEPVATVPVRPAPSGRVRLAWDTAPGERYTVATGPV